MIVRNATCLQSNARCSIIGNDCHNYEPMSPQFGERNLQFDIA
ncbi:hypothetical protein SAMN05421819_1274 [Bryocella elongata]|uniref:Uncharacterized protein n=1 Tax=Bryocella elongata TaxID=863522 RepID=A0A1H5V1J1_9BACT|nr:hypothetical protein SAMN05421819_1274 [Bryocella elongata]